MSNPAFAVGLVVEGTDLQENPMGYGLEVVTGLDDSPVVEGSDAVPLGATAGSYARNRKLIGRKLEIVGIVKASSLADYRNRSQALHALFMPGVFLTVVCLQEDATTATIEARTDTFTMKRHGPTTGWVAVQLHAVVPNWTLS